MKLLSLIALWFLFVWYALILAVVSCAILAMVGWDVIKAVGQSVKTSKETK